jgi:hypothetical protein
MRTDSERYLTQEELNEGYTYASDGSMRTPEGQYFIKLYGTNETSPEVIQAESGSMLDKAVNKIGGLLGLGSGDPNAAYSALFGGGAYIPGSIDASGAFMPIAWGSKETNQAIEYMDAVLQDPNSSQTDKQLAQQAVNKIKAGEVGGGSGETVGGGSGVAVSGNQPASADQGETGGAFGYQGDFASNAGTGTNVGTGTGTGTGSGVGGGTADGSGIGDGTAGGTGVADSTGTGTGSKGTGTGSGTGNLSLTGGSTASQALAYGSVGASSGPSQGALPKNLNPTYLSAAPIGDSTMNLGQLKQLYPQLSGVDPRLLSILTGRSKSMLGGDQSGGSTAFSGTNLITPSAGFPARASGQDQAGVTAFAPTNDLMNNSYDAMSAAGLRSLGALPSAGSPYGLKGGGKVENRNSAPHIPEFITGKTGHYVDGKGDGQSDDIPAMLADGEYVFDADTVSALGNGSSKAGAQLLDHFRESLREHKRSAPTDKIPPAASPLQYMKEALKRHKG